MNKRLHIPALCAEFVAGIAVVISLDFLIIDLSGLRTCNNGQTERAWSPRTGSRASSTSRGITSAILFVGPRIRASAYALGARYKRLAREREVDRPLIDGEGL